MITGCEFGLEVCKALGIEANHIRRIVMDVQAGEVVRLYLEEYPDKEKLNALAKVFDVVNCKYLNVERGMVRFSDSDIRPDKVV